MDREAWQHQYISVRGFGLLSTSWSLSSSDSDGGASRGIGLSIVTELVDRPDTVIYAAARDPSNAKDLLALTRTHVNVRLVKLDATSQDDHQALPGQIQEGRVDFVLANAGPC